MIRLICSLMLVTPLIAAAVTVVAIAYDGRSGEQALLVVLVTGAWAVLAVWRAGQEEVE